MKIYKKIKDANLLIKSEADHHSASDLIYHDAEFFEWLKGKFPENVRFSIRRTLAQRTRIKNIVIVISSLMISEVLLAAILVHIQTILLLFCPLMNIGLYGVIAGGLIKNMPAQQHYDRFLIRHFNEFDSTEFIYRTLNNILYSMDHDVDEKLIAKFILGKTDPKDIRI